MKYAIEYGQEFSDEPATVDVEATSEDEALRYFWNNVVDDTFVVGLAFYAKVVGKREATERVVCGDTFDVLPTLADNSVDFVCTSPPYDSMRNYDGFPLLTQAKRIELGRELYRVCKPGSICAVVIGDETKDFAESLTSFRWALDFVDGCDWKLFETLLYVRERTPGKRAGFATEHEYVFCFLKGDKPKTINKEHLQVLNSSYGKKWTQQRRVNDKWEYGSQTFGIPKTKDRGTVWYYASSCNERNLLKLNHPATYPEKLASDLLRCFSNEGDTVLDCFAGSGTTLVQAKKWKRGYIGVEISPKYADIINKRLRNEIEIDVFSEEGL